MHLAICLKRISKNPFANYKLKVLKVNWEHLSQRELSLMENKVFTIERIDMVGDLFIFYCYTGLTYIDKIHLSPDHIVETADNEIWIRTCRQETDVPVNTPLLPKALEIQKNIKAILENC